MEEIVNQRTAFSKKALLYALSVFVLGAGTTLQAGVLYNQPFDGTGDWYASQNDTNPGGFGNFATVYDNFTLAGGGNITGVQFTGAYANPPTQGTITAWTLDFYNDSAGSPGSIIATGTFSGTGNETLLGTFAGYPTYTYELDFGAYGVGPGTYWLSVVPDLGFPPQWGWSTGTGGDGVMYQNFFGVLSTYKNDMAFTILGTTSGVPEPASMALAGLGFGLLLMARSWRKRSV
jgi:PEP-CTERM motif